MKTRSRTVKVNEKVYSKRKIDSVRKQCIELRAVVTMAPPISK